MSVLPRSGLNFFEQLEKSLQDLEEKAKAWGTDLSNVLLQTFFIHAEDNDDYFSKKALGTSLLQKFYKSDTPATSFVAQHPEFGKQVSLDAVLLSNPDRGEVHHKSYGSIRYTTVESPLLTEVYAAGLTNSPDQFDTRARCQEAFDSMKRVLKSESLDFSHIVRQWNYIENFLEINAASHGTRQNYQIFNDCRSSYYSEAEFSTGYPAATGIGTYAGGIILECIAMKAATDIYISPLSNPLQADAHAYSQGVLVGDVSLELKKKAPPLFDRAKVIILGDSGIIFVSGTAAIRGQNTIPEEDIQIQTAITIENIDTLISADNLLSNGVDIGPNSPRLSQLRAYVKREKDLPLVKKICKDHYGDIPSQFVLSDICREALLVEIEGTACVPIHGIQRQEGG